MDWKWNLGAATEALLVASDFLAELVAFRRNGGL